jgi:hypothetical protein
LGGITLLFLEWRLISGQTKTVYGHMMIVISRCVNEQFIVSYNQLETVHEVHEGWCITFVLVIAEDDGILRGLAFEE